MAPQISFRGRTLLQHGTWNVQGKQMDAVLSYLQASGCDFDVLSVQEVSLGTSLESGHHEFIEYSEFGYKVLAAHPKGCFRAVAIAFDIDNVLDVSKIHVGYAHVSAVIRFTDGPSSVFVTSVHLPTARGPMMNSWMGLEQASHNGRGYSW